MESTLAWKRPLRYRIQYNGIFNLKLMGQVYVKWQRLGHNYYIPGGRIPGGSSGGEEEGVFLGGKAE